MHGLLAATVQPYAMHALLEQRWLDQAERLEMNLLPCNGEQACL